MGGRAGRFDDLRREGPLIFLRAREPAGEDMVGDVIAQQRTGDANDRGRIKSARKA